jgi:hypothetical protein
MRASPICFVGHDILESDINTYWQNELVISCNEEYSNISNKSILFRFTNYIHVTYTRKMKYDPWVERQACSLRRKELETEVEEHTADLNSLQAGQKTNFLRKSRERVFFYF